jgi:hypothetical protein
MGFLCDFYKFSQDPSCSKYVRYPSEVPLVTDNFESNEDWHPRFCLIKLDPVTPECKLGSSIKNLRESRNGYGAPLVNL